MDAVSIGTAVQDTLDVVLRGEIDFTNAAWIGQTVRTAVADRRPASVRVEMAEVAFLDSAGVGVLVEIMKAAEAAGAAFRVEHPSSRVLDQLRTAGLLAAFGLA
ncbi:STAS domain-containing protein [Planobispora takensis]|uniref:Anti-sigma factor antagonist n=1 Tax=Planobispora takensis TaxID=1367882 RepID=A0A8J3SYC1_9ACTN|nr:STAS domain-containing protein [Planobispora takensis]GII02413.1 hypothetical protein Pta02_44210 [Planobispora takensis]